MNPRLEADRLQEEGQPDAVDGLADTLVFKRVVGKEFEQIAPKSDQLFKILVGVEFYEGHHHHAHHVADF